MQSGHGPEVEGIETFTIDLKKYLAILIKALMLKGLEYLAFSGGAASTSASRQSNYLDAVVFLLRGVYDNYSSTGYWPTAR